MGNIIRTSTSIQRLPVVAKVLKGGKALPALGQKVTARKG